MLPVEVLSTMAVPSGQRVAFWNDLACRTLTRLVADPVDRSDFFGQIRCANLGAIRVAEISSDAARVHHLHSHITQNDDASCLLQFQLSGCSVNRQDGREARLAPGDFTLRDCTRPYEVAFDEPVSMLALRIPGEVFRRYVARPEKIVAVPVSGSSGPGGLVSRFLRDLWHNPETVPGPDFASRLAPTILDLIATAYLTVPQAQPQPSSLATARRVEILNHIEAHLADPDLTPQTIAARFRITTRYLHRLLEQEAETPSRYILRRRLEASSRTLTNPLRLHCSITFIAFQHGFNSVAHFCKAFRDRYGLSPRDYRRAGLGE
jgi:AraC-like DNA-binding protein